MDRSWTLGPSLRQGPGEGASVREKLRPVWDTSEGLSSSLPFALS